MSSTSSFRFEEAFARFVDHLGDWWPSEYTWSEAALEGIGIEPREGGMCFEHGPHGFRCDWGRVLTVDRPRSVVLTWQIGPNREPVPDPSKASEVEVRFEPEDETTTRVELEHRGFDRHGAAAENYRAALASEQGWPYILSRYAAVTQEATEATEVPIVGQVTTGVASLL
jgi:uncharacterized protein YndB with AHSA1/START domain